MAGQYPRKAQPLPNTTGLPNPYALPLPNTTGLPNPYAPMKALDPNVSAAVASAAPVKSAEEQARDEQRRLVTAFHNPLAGKRHNTKTNSLPKIRSIPAARMASNSKAPASSSPAAPVSTDPVLSAATTTTAEQRSIDYYRSNADDDAAVVEERRQRQYEDKQKKKEQKKFEQKYGKWDGKAPYDPMVPTNLPAYLATGHYEQKYQEFLASLKDGYTEEEIQEEERIKKGIRERKAAAKAQWESRPRSRSPVRFSFAPPVRYNTPVVDTDEEEDCAHHTRTSEQRLSAANNASSLDVEDEDPYERRMRMSQQQQSQTAPPLPDEQVNRGKFMFAPPSSYDAPSVDASKEDPYAYQMSMSEQQQQAQSYIASAAPPHHEQFERNIPPPPPEVSHADPLTHSAFEHRASPPPPPPVSGSSPHPTAYQGTISAPPVRYANTSISAPAVRYERPDIQMKEDPSEPAYEERPVKRPKISKAEAMMGKMGWKKGEGLGKNNDGVTTALEVRKRKVPQGASTLDDEGGKVRSQQVWDVTGGMRKHADEPDKFGKPSTVVVTWGCVEGVNWEANAARDDGGIRQEMGEAFSAKMGPVEHIQLDESNAAGTVYIHFKSEMSAMNAVNRFSEGWEFRGRQIKAQYYDERKFHERIYDY